MNGAAPAWTDRRTSGTRVTQTRASIGGNVIAEGGGIAHPTLMGGGTGFSREPLVGRRLWFEAVPA